MPKVIGFYYVGSRLTILITKATVCNKILGICSGIVSWFFIILLGIMKKRHNPIFRALSS